MPELDSYAVGIARTSGDIYEAWTVVTTPPTLAEQRAASCVRRLGQDRPRWWLVGCLYLVSFILMWFLDWLSDRAVAPLEIAWIVFLMMALFGQWERRGFVDLVQRYHAELLRRVDSPPNKRMHATGASGVESAGA